MPVQVLLRRLGVRGRGSLGLGYDEKVMAVPIIISALEISTHRQLFSISAYWQWSISAYRHSFRGICMVPSSHFLYKNTFIPCLYIRNKFPGWISLVVLVSGVRSEPTLAEQVRPFVGDRAKVPKQVREVGSFYIEPKTQARPFIPLELLLHQILQVALWVLILHFSIGNHCSLPWLRQMSFDLDAFVQVLFMGSTLNTCFFAFNACLKASAGHYAWAVELSTGIS